MPISGAVINPPDWTCYHHRLTAPFQGMPDNPLVIDCQSLTIATVIDVARRGRKVVLGERALAAMEASRAVVDRIASGGEVVYGVTTGFGRMAHKHIPPRAREELQRNLVRSHAVGVGEPLPSDVVRAMMVLRIA